MTKAAIIVGTLIIYDNNALVQKEGTLVSHDAETIVLDVKRPRSSKSDREMFNVADVKQAWLAEGDNAAYVYIRGYNEDSYPDVTMGEVTNGYFSGSAGDTAIVAAAGTWRFLPNEDEAEEAPAKGKAKPAGKKVAVAEPEPDEEPEEKPAKGKKPAAKVEPEPEPDPVDEYEPAKGDSVTVTEEDGTEDTGEVEAINAKSITVNGTKYIRADVTVVAAEEVAAYEPAEDDYVSVVDGDGDEVTGTVSALTTKKMTVTDDAGEEHSFVLAKVTVSEAEKPKKTTKKPAGKKVAEPEPDDEPEEKPAKGGKAKPAAKAVADDDWNTD